MQRSMSIKVPNITVVVQSLPPMYDWPVTIKRAILGACTILCIIAYVLMAAGFFSLATLVLGLL